MQSLTETVKGRSVCKKGLPCALGLPILEPIKINLIHHDMSGMDFSKSAN